MILAERALDDARGAVLVHTTRAKDTVLKKGRVLSAADLEGLRAAGFSSVWCAVLDDDDVGEDEAAHRLAWALASPHLSLAEAKTGRCNLHARGAGLFTVDALALSRLNELDERITVATLADGTPVRAGDMVATVKIIPLAVPGAVLTAAIDLVREADHHVRNADASLIQKASREEHLRGRHEGGASEHVRWADDPDSGHSRPADDPDSGHSRVVEVHPWAGKRAGLVLTRVPDTHPRLLERAAAAQRTRLERCGGTLAQEQVTPHREADVAKALAEQAALGLEPILVLGASAIMDRQDVIPRALELAGGEVLRLGMPVDPGNLLMVGRLGQRMVLGVPGCARSLKRSGFDWVLERCCAGVEFAPRQLATLGAGGLLEESELRPSPRDEGEGRPQAPALGEAPRVAALVLAAGKGTRMGAAKQLELLDGKPLVRWAVEAALGSTACRVIVVTGHEGARVAQALDGLPVELVHNPHFAEGLASSLRTGLEPLDRGSPVAGALICLGDMPRVTSTHLDKLIAAFDTVAAPIVVPTCERKRGNPVLWASQYFSELRQLRGDVGARSLLEQHGEQVTFLALEDPAILLDVDTPQALAALRDSPL